MKTEFNKGDELYWLRGDVHIVATVIEVNEDSVYVRGLTTDYWVKKAALIKNINKAYPCSYGRATF